MIVFEMVFSTDEIGIEVRSAWHDFIDGQQPVYFVTLVFNGKVNFWSARSRLKRFDAKVDAALLGRRFYNKSDEDRTLFFAFLEKADSHPHFHLLVKPAGGEAAQYKREAIRVWKKICPSGSIRVVIPKNKGRTIRYCAKKIGNPSAYQEIILSTELRRDGLLMGYSA